MRTLVLILGAALAFETSATAATEGVASAAIAKIAAELDRCQAKPDNHNTIAINGCYSDAVTAADKVLADVYQAAVMRLSQSAARHSDERKDDLEMRRRLVASQHAWDAYRDADCSLQATYSLGGTGEAADEAQCEFDKATERVKSLEQWAKDNVRDK